MLLKWWLLQLDEDHRMVLSFVQSPATEGTQWNYVSPNIQIAMLKENYGSDEVNPPASYHPLFQGAGGQGQQIPRDSLSAAMKLNGNQFPPYGIRGSTRPHCLP